MRPIYPQRFSHQVTCGQAEGATLPRNTHRSARESGPSWPVCRSAPSRRQTSTSATVYEKKLALGRETREGTEARPSSPPSAALLSMHTWPPAGTESPGRLGMEGSPLTLPAFPRVPASYLRWERCGGKAEPTGTGPSWGEKQSPDEVVVSATTV